MLYIQRAFYNRLGTQLRPYPDKSSSSDGIFNVEVGRYELSLIIRFHVLLVFGKCLKASAASVVVIKLLS
jgi:hypothetical protein